MEGDFISFNDDLCSSGVLIIPIYLANAASEQRPKFMSILHGLYVKPLSSRRLLHAFVSCLFTISLTTLGVCLSIPKPMDALCSQNHV
jgi:hypothetical protein